MGGTNTNSISTLVKEMLITLKDITSTNSALIALTKDQVYQAGIEDLLNKFAELEAILEQPADINEDFFNKLFQ